MNRTVSFSMARAFSNEGPQSSTESPELALWASVFATSLDDLQYSQKTRRSALAWIDSLNREVGSFLWTCTVLDMDASAVRKSLLAAKQIRRPRW